MEGRAGKTGITAAAACLAVCAVLAGMLFFARGAKAAGADYTVTKDRYGHKWITAYSPANEQKRFEVPSDIAGIAAGAFNDVDSLEVLVLSHEVLFEEDSFTDCDSLKTIELGYAPAELHNDQIARSGLRPERFTASEGNGGVKIVDGAAYSWSEEYGGIWNGAVDINMRGLIAYPCGKPGDEYTVPEGVKVVRKGAFAGSSLKKVDLPRSLVMIDLRAFDGCSRLETLTIPNNVFDAGFWSFAGCDSLRSVTLPPHIGQIDIPMDGGLGPADINRAPVIRGTEGSRAQTFAVENGISFEPAEIEPYAQQIKTPYSGGTLSMTYGDSAKWIDIDAMTTMTYQLSDESVAKIEMFRSPTSWGGPDEPQLAMTVRPLKAGTATLTLRAKGNDAFKAAETRITINVKKKPQTVTTAKSAYSGTCGKTVPLGAKAATVLTYKSSDRAIAEVSRDGKIKFKKPGKAKITITAAEAENIGGAKKTVTVSSALAVPKLTAMATKGKTKLSWKKVAGASQVQVYVKYPGRKKYTKVLTRPAKVRSVTHKGMKSGKVYRYKVRMRVKVNGKYRYSRFSKVKTVRAR